MKFIFLRLAIILIVARSASSALSAGYVVGWGDNFWGEVTGEATPTDFTNGIAKIHGQVLSNAVTVSAGYSYSLAIKNDGTVAAWGSNERGETTIPDGLSKVVAVYIGAPNVALKSDGRAVTWGALEGNTNTLAGFSNIVAISGGVLLQSDGKVVAWGKPGPNPGPSGAIFVPSELSNVVAIAGQHSIKYAVRKDGTVVEWSLQGQIEVERIPFVDTNDPSRTVRTRNADYKVLEGIKSPVALAAGWSHNLALFSDGTIFGWGANGDGESTGVPTTKSPYYAEGLVTIGGQVLSNVTAVAAGNHMSLALKKDGTIVSWGFSPYHRMDVPAGLSNVVAIAIASGDGDKFCLAITTNKAVADKFRRQ